MLILIVAVDNNFGIGFQNKTPWSGDKRYSRDMKWFREITSKGKNAVLMGRKTFESIEKPLPKRFNIVISKSMKQDDQGNLVFRDHLKKAIDEFKSSFDDLFVIGGAEIYQQCIELVDKMYITHLNQKFECDRFFPKFDPKNYEIKVLDQDENLTIIEYLNNAPSEEQQYLDLVKEVLESGHLKSNRTGVDTKSLFGKTLHFSLSHGIIPLLTTKKMFWKGIVEELLWFLSGSTDVSKLQEKGIHIWDDNSSEEFLKDKGLKKGDIGPTYGMNFRHYGAQYIDCKTDYTNQGYDQVKFIIQEIQRNPNSRRLIIDLWNPLVLDKISLPPCLFIYQFYVHNNKLSCSTYQRSGDLGLGVPFNIASASLLTHIIANLTHLEPHELIYNLGDAHIYVNHIESLKLQLQRLPYSFPTLKIKNKEKLEELIFEDFELLNYLSHPAIKMEMAV